MAVDIMIMIHSSGSAIRSTGKDLTNSRGEITSHLHGIFYKSIAFLQKGIIPIYVFDGKSLDIKQSTIEKRNKCKIEAQKKVESIDDTTCDEYKKYYARTFKLIGPELKQTKILLDLMGIPYIQAPNEADPVCAWLAARTDGNGKRYVKGVCSDDSDMLTLGAPYLFKNMSKFMSDNKLVEVVSLNKTLKGLGITMTEFIDFCVLLGTDYNKNIEGIGPVNAFKLIKKYKTLDKVLQHACPDPDSDSEESEETESMRQEQINSMITAQKYFTNALATIDDLVNTNKLTIKLDLCKIKSDELIDYMVNVHGFDGKKICANVKTLQTIYDNMNITSPNITNYVIENMESIKNIQKCNPTSLDFISDSDEE
jgi:flap endonuclease-1